MVDCTFVCKILSVKNDYFAIHRHIYIPFALEILISNIEKIVKNYYYLLFLIFVLRKF